MRDGITPASKPRRRRRKTLLPTSAVVLDSIAIVLLAILPVIVIWVFGGNRFWVMGPAILLVMLSALLFLYRFFWSSAHYDMVIPPGGLLLLLFLGYLALILPRAEIPYDAWLELFRYLSYGIAYWIWFNLLRLNKRWKWVLILLMFSVSIMAWYSLIQEVHGTNMVLNTIRPEQYKMRASGAYICPNHFANLLGMMIPVCVGLALYRGAGIPIRLIAGYTAFMCLPALYLTESRSGWIGLLTGAVVLAVSVSIQKGIKKFLVVLVAAPLLAGAVGAGVWMASPRVQARVEAAIKGDIRLPLWQDSLVIAREKPVLGSGLGSYYWMYPHYRVHYTDNANPEFAHNDYLQFWAEIGVVGLALMALIVFCIVRRSIWIIRETDRNDVYLMAGMLGCMAGTFAHAFFDFNFHIFGNVHVFVFLMAALMAATYDKSADQTVSFASAKSKAVSGIVMLLLVFLSVTYARAVVSYFHVLSAEEQVGKLKWSQAQKKYETAMRWSPGNWKAHIGQAHLLRTRSFWSRDKATRSEWLKEARERYSLVEGMNPWEADVYFGLGGVSQMEGDQEAALRYKRIAVEKVPRQTAYLNELGLQLREMKRYDEALEVFKESKSVESTPAAERNIKWLIKKRASNT